MPAADERQLIFQAQEGSHSAYRNLVEQHMKQAYNVAFGFVHDHESARDILQEALIKAYEALPAFRGEAQFSTWLQRIVMNLSLNYVRASTARTKRETRITLDVPEEHHEAALFQWDHKDHIERALHELPTLQRAAVILRHIEGLSTQQVSEILHCSQGTVKTHLFRGLHKLRKRLAYLQKEVA
jgi:RNA polymerase sigma-70 factor (ECF subfamily)